MAAAVQGILLVLLAVSLCRALVGRRRGDIPSKILENGETTTTSTTTASTRRQQGPFDWGLPDWSGPHFELSWDIPGLMDEGIGEWWSGPNVCVTREEIHEEAARGRRMHYFQSTIDCDQTQTMYKCVRIVNMRGKRKKITVIHQCCHGYERERGRHGCGKRLELTDLFTTAEKLDSGHFVRALRRIGSSEIGRKNFTLFAPTDEAFREAGLIQHVNPQVVVVSRELGRLAQNLENTLMSHVVPNLFRTSALYDEQLLDTSVTDNRIRINFYYTPKRVVMANCVPLNSTDNLATTGVIHTVNKVLHPVKESLFDLISRRPEFSTLVQLVRKAGLESKLQQKGQYTLFAPTNTAFGKLDQFVRDKILRGEDCLADVVWNHLLPNVVCSGVIEGRMRSCNVLEKCMNLTGDRSGGITVNNVPLVRRDVMATNGVLHSIDQVFVPDEALGVVHVANKVGATQFTELVKEAGLSKMLQSLSNFTVFLPTNEAVQRLPEEKRNELRRDHQRLGKIIKYHIVPSEQHHYDLHNDLELATLDSTTKKLLIKEYSKFRFPWGRETMATVQCAPIHHTDINACGGVVHIIDKMLVPPAGSVVDLLSRDDRFSRLLQLLRTANLFDELASLGPLTFFAPTNEAFRKVSDSVMTGPLADPEKLKLILKHHMVHDILCCAGVFHRRVARYHTLDGSTVGVARRRNGVYADDVRLTECDLMANGGVVHAVNSLLPRALRMYTDTNTRMSHLFRRPRQFFEHMFSDWGLDLGKK